MQISTMPIYLASTSPRRRELIKLFGLAFQFISADVDESPRENEAPADLVQRLSRAKATIGLQNAHAPDAMVIGADTIVAFEGLILGKPCDADDAVRMLKQLRAKLHVVYSGITVLQTDRACQDYLQINCPVAREILSVQYSVFGNNETAY